MTSLNNNPLIQDLGKQCYEEVSECFDNWIALFNEPIAQEIAFTSAAEAFWKTGKNKLIADVYTIIRRYEVKARKR